MSRTGPAGALGSQMQPGEDPECRTLRAPGSERPVQRTLRAPGSERPLERTLRAPGTERPLERTLRAPGTERALRGDAVSRSSSATPTVNSEPTVNKAKSKKQLSDERGPSRLS